MVESVTLNTQQTQPTLEEQAAALEAAKNSQNPDPSLSGETAQRPENVPEKFWDAEKGEVNTEALLASYSALEGKQGGNTENNSQVNGENNAENNTDAANKAVADAGLDMEALSAEYADKGELTQESLDALAKVGITSEMVDSYITGQEAQANAVRDSLLEPVGGEEAYNDMVGWASDNLAEADIDAFNAVLESGDANATKMAVENLHAKYVAANGQEPQRQLNGKPGDGSLAVYESTADLMKDMQNPEYAKNPAFRAKVEAKLGRSSIM